MRTFGEFKWKKKTSSSCVSVVLLQTLMSDGSLTVSLRFASTKMYLFYFIRNGDVKATLFSREISCLQTQ